MKSRGIVDAVSHIPHDIAGLLEGEDDALLLIGLDFSEDVHVDHASEQRTVAQLTEVWTCEDFCI